MKLRIIISVLSALVFFATVIGGFLFYDTLTRRVDEEAGLRAEELVKDIADDLSMHVEEHLRSLDFISKEERFAEALQYSGPDSLLAANKLLDRLYSSLEVMQVCYLMDRDGKTIASSNRNTPGSFVGKNYSFRPYFKEAINGNPFTYIALGVTSNKRGLYYSYPVYGNDEQPIGVIVIKESIEHLNGPINRPHEGIMMMTGLNGVVMFSNRDDWLFKTLWELSPKALERIAESKQFGKGPWEWTGTEKSAGHDAVDAEGKLYHLHEKEIGGLPGWEIIYLHDHNLIISNMGSALLKQTSKLVLLASIFFGLLVVYLYRTASRDISERKKAEAALRESGEKFKAYFEKAPTGYQSLDENGCFIDVNEAWLAALQYDRDEVIGRSFAGFLAPGYAEKFRDNFPCFKETGEILGIDFEMLRKDGSVAIMSINGKVGYDSEGNFKQTHCLLNDITEHRKFEQEREELTNQIKERNKELQQILYTVSHDLRSPLINIQGYSKILANSLQKAIALFEGEDISEDVRKKMDAIIEEDISESKDYIILSIRKMDSLLAGLLKLSRTTRAELKTEEINMNSLLSDITRTLDFQIKDSGVVVEVFDLPLCYGDEFQINQVFSNLIGNALKYLDPDRPGVIKVSGEERDGQIVYCVEDNGIGIPEGYREKVFEIFDQVDSEKDGEGLGLTIVRKILERHGGKIWVESEEGKGSKFFVALPQKQLRINNE